MKIPTPNTMHYCEKYFNPKLNKRKQSVQESCEISNSENSKWRKFIKDDFSNLINVAFLFKFAAFFNAEINIIF